MNKELIRKTFKEVKITQASIIQSGKTLLDNMAFIEEMLEILKDVFREFLKDKKNNQNVLSLFFLANEVIFKLKFKSQEKELKLFSECLKDLGDDFNRAEFDIKFVQQIIGVLQIWKKKSVMEIEIINKLFQTFEEKKNKEQAIELDKVDFNIKDLAVYAETYARHEKWENSRKKSKEKIEKFKLEANEDEALLEEAKLKKCEEMCEIYNKSKNKVKCDLSNQIHADMIKLLQALKKVDSAIDEINKLQGN